MSPDKERALREENEKLKDEIKRLRKENEKIKKEFENYKTKHVQTVVELRKALRIKPEKKKKRLRLGAPKGHKGYSRCIPERIDYIKKLDPQKCPHCNSELSDTQEIRSRYVTDLKLLMSVKTTRYDIHRKYCSHCKKLVELKPKNVLPRARFGLTLMLFIMYLKLGLRTPSEKIVEYLQDIHGLTISESEIYCILTQLAELFGDYYNELEKMLRVSRAKHTDSTSWRINGKNYNAWVFIATGIVLYKIAKRNNHKVALTIFGKKQKAKILVVDRHSAFRTLAEKTGFHLQLCWSHILVDSRDLKKSFGKEAKYVHERLKKIYAEAKALNHAGTEKDVDCLKKKIFLLTKRHYKNQIVWRFTQNLYKRDIDNLFPFVTNPDVDPTNNISERELRKIVIIRKISNGSRSKQGAKNTATLLSIIQTLRNNKQNLFQQLQKLAITSQG